MAITPIHLAMGNYPNVQNAFSGPPGAAGVVLDASGDKLAMVIQVPKSGTLHSFQWLMGAAVANQPDNGLKLSFQDIDTATGFPDGTADQFIVMPQPFTVDTWQVPSGPMTHDGTGGGTKRTVVKGEHLCCVIEFSSFVASDSITVGAFIFNSTNSDVNQQLSYIVDGSSGAYSKVRSCPLLALRYDDDTYGIFTYWNAPFTSLNTHTFASNSTPDERGMRFTVPFNGTLKSLVTKITWTAAFDVVLYDSVDTVLATKSITAGMRVGTSSAGPQTTEIIIPGTINITADEVYRITIKPTTTTTIIWYSYNIDNALRLAAYPGGDTWYSTVRTDAGAWTDSQIIRPVMSLIFDGIELSSGGGGGGSYVF